MSKSFLEIFYKYKPDADDADILQTATDIKIQADKENRMLQAYLSFPRTIKKETLYRIEKEIAKAYDLNRMTIFPYYDASLFCEEYIPEILIESGDPRLLIIGHKGDPYTCLAQGGAPTDHVFRRIRLLVSGQGVIDVANQTADTHLLQVLRRDRIKMFHVQIGNEKTFKNHEMFSASKRIVYFLRRFRPRWQ